MDWSDFLADATRDWRLRVVDSLWDPRPPSPGATEAEIAGAESVIGLLPGSTGTF